MKAPEKEKNRNTMDVRFGNKHLEKEEEPCKKKQAEIEIKRCMKWK